MFCTEWTQEWIDPADIDAAKAALDALVEAESEEWVAWTVGGTTQYRARGDEIQWWYHPTSSWRDEGNTSIGTAYRKGREVALEESAELRNAARELVEVVKDMPTFNQVDCWDWLKAVKAAAKALEGKL